MCPKTRAVPSGGMRCVTHDAFTVQVEQRPTGPNHTVPYGTEPVCYANQALRTWLPSFSPCGTKTIEACPPNRLHSKLTGPQPFEDEDDDEDEDEDD